MVATTEPALLMRWYSGLHQEHHGNVNHKVARLLGASLIIVVEKLSKPKLGGPTSRCSPLGTKMGYSPCLR